MPFVTVGTEKNQPVELFYQDAGVGTGDPIVLIHGWPYDHNMWEYQVPELVAAGHRVIAYDRRGFGQSTKTWDGYDYDTLASDLHALLTTLDLSRVTLVGFSMGGGEVARYLSTYGSARIKSAALLGAVTPFMMRTDDNPEGVEASVLEGIHDALTTDRLAFLPDFVKMFFNYGVLRHDISREAYDFHIWKAQSADWRATVRCAESFSQTDFRKDLTAFDVPTLVIHGDADQVVPFDNSGKRAAEMITGAELHVLDGAPHGFQLTHTHELNELLVKFTQQ